MYVFEICAEGIFVTFPWWLKNVKSRSTEIAPFFFKWAPFFKFDFQKRKQLRLSDVNYLNYTKKDPNLPVTTTFSLKQGETRTNGVPISHQWRSKDVWGPWTTDSPGPLPILHNLIPLTPPPHTPLLRLCTRLSLSYDFRGLTFSSEGGSQIYKKLVSLNCDPPIRQQKFYDSPPPPITDILLNRLKLYWNQSFWTK